MKRLFGSKGGQGPSPLEHGVKGGRMQCLTLKGVMDPLGDGGDLQIWDISFRGLFDDGITDQNGNGRRRLRQFMAQNGPTHPVADEKTGQRRLTQYVFGNIEVGIHRSILQRDTNECGSEGEHALKLGLEALIREEFSQRLWKPELGVRVAIGIHDLDPDVVQIWQGRGVDVPAVDDDPIADVSITVVDANGEEHPVRLPTFKYYDGKPGHLRLTEKPRVIYSGSAYFMVASQDELAPVVIPSWGDEDGESVVRVGIDLNRRIGLAETRDGLMGEEIVPEQPEPGVDLYRFDQPGLSPIPGGRPQSLVIAIRQCTAQPAPDIAPKDPWIEQIPPIDFDEEEDLAPPSPFAQPDPLTPDPQPDPVPEHEEERTIVVGPRPGVATSVLALEATAIALPKIYGGSGISHWCLQLNDDGRIIRDQESGPGSVRIGASSAKPGLSVTMPGGMGWRQLDVPANLSLASAGSLEIVSVDPTLADIYLGFLELSQPITLTLPSGRNIFGRSGRTVDNKLAIGLLMQEGSLKVDGAPSSNCMEYLGLSRDHLALWVEGDAIQVELLGQTPAWRLNGDLEVEEELLPGSQGKVTVFENDHILVGPYLMRAVRI